MTETMEVLRSLRAVRTFSEPAVPADVLGEVLEVARWTGSAKNTQPWELIVVRDRGMLRELAGLGQYAGHLAGAPLAIALVMDGPGRAFDAGRLAQNIMVAAWAHGVGSCIASIFPAENEEHGKQLLGVPAERSMHTVLALGYPAGREALRLSSAPPAVRSEVPLGRKPLTALVSWERFGQRDPSA